MFARIFFLLYFVFIAQAAHADWYVSPLNSTLTGQSVYLTNAQNEEIPHVLVRQKIATTTNTIVYPKLNILESTGSINKTMILDTTKEGQTYTGIYLTIPPDFKNFKKVARVFISDTLLGASSPSWKEIEKRTIIYRYTDVDGFQLQNLKISFPDLSTRYIKVQLDESTTSDTSITITEAQIEYDAQKNQQEKTIKEYVSGNFDTPGIAGTKEISLDDTVFQNSIDITHITLKVDKNILAFREPVTIETSDDGITWKFLVKGEVYRVASPVYEGEQLTISIPQTTSAFMRITTNLEIDDTIIARLRKSAVLFKMNTTETSGLQIHIDKAGIATSSYILQNELSKVGGVIPKTVTFELSEDTVAKRQLGNRFMIYSAIFLIAGILGYLRYRRSRRV